MSSGQDVIVASNETENASESLSLVSEEVVVTTSAIEETSHYYDKLSKAINSYAMAIIVLVGILGNGLSFAVMQRRRMRRRSVSVYLSALAVADTAVLVLDFLNNWLKSVPNIYLLGTSNAFCRFHRSFFDVCFIYAAWLVVALSVERFIVVCLPLKARVLLQRRYAIITVCLLPLPILAVSMVNTWAWGVDVNGQCNMLPQYSWYVSFVHPWIVGTLYSYIPCAMLVGCSTAIIIKLVRAHALRMTMTRAMDNPTTDSNKLPEDNRTEMKVSIIVVIICISFLLLTLPVTLFFALIFGAGNVVVQGPDIMLAETFILILGLSNHAINFWLYAVASRAFRAELKAMLFCRSTKQTHGSTSSAPTKSTENASIDTRF